MRPGAAGTAGRDYRVPPKGGRHRADNPPAPVEPEPVP